MLFDYDLESLTEIMTSALSPYNLLPLFLGFEALNNVPKAMNVYELGPSLCCLSDCARLSSSFELCLQLGAFARRRPCFPLALHYRTVIVRVLEAD